jgi:hypothetical protein
VLLPLALLAQLAAPHYVDLARQWGVTGINTYGGRTRKEYILETTGNGAAILDFDGDGRNDLLITNGATLDGSGAAPYLYRNEGGGRFADVSRQAGLTSQGWGQGVCAGDYDNDGDPDVLLTYYGYDRLYNNAGNGRFTDATATAKLRTTGTRWGGGCAFVDYDRDGWLDLFIANYVELDLKKTPRPGQAPECKWKGLDVMCGPKGLPPALNVLYRNNGDGTFSDVSERAGIVKPGGRYGLGVIAADFDNDGWPDIYVACDQTPSLYYRNRGDGAFQERGAEAGVAYNFDGRLQAGMGVAVADYDGNGFLDIAKTNFSGDLPSLYNNEDGRFFNDLSQQAGLGRNQLLGWGAAFLDADEDGWKDLILANGHVYPEVDRGNFGERYLQKTLFYRNLGNGRFADLAGQAGPAFEPPRPARGLATGDLDGDGHPEIVIVNMNEVPSVLKNQGPRQNWISVAVQGTKSNRSGIGTRVTIEAGGRRQVDEVRSGGSFYSQNELALHFGLGAAKMLDRLEVRWPSGRVQEWKQAAANRKLLVIEGAPELQARD